MPRQPRRRIQVTEDRSSVAERRDFEEVDVETRELPEGVRLRWFRSNLARPVIDDVAPGVEVESGAVVFGEGKGDRPGAVVVVALPTVEEGPRALAEPAVGEYIPTVREAVLEALAALPEAIREGASAEAEKALSAAGL